MPPIRILHTADIHLDSPLRSLALRDPDLRAAVESATRTAFATLVDYAIAEGVAALLIAGDLFDGTGRSAHTAAFLVSEFDRLAAHAIAVFIIRGNHDAESPITNAIEWPANVHVFTGHGGKKQLCEGIWIHGVSFAKPHAPESLLPQFRAAEPGAINIAMLHTSLAGAEGHDVYAPCTTTELTGMGFDYWALGHVHKRQIHGTAPWIVMPGTPQGRDIGETGPKSASLITIEHERLTLSEVPTAAIEFHAVPLDITDCADETALRHAIRDCLRTICETLRAQSGVVRLILTGQNARAWQIARDRDIWHETTRTAARDTGKLWLDKLVLDLHPPKTTSATPSAVEELASLMATIRAEPGFAAAAADAVEAVFADLPQALRARCLPDPQALVDLAAERAQDGVLQTLARMRGAIG